MPIRSLKKLLNELVQKEMHENLFARVVEAEYENLKLLPGGVRANYEEILKPYKQYSTLKTLPAVKIIADKREEMDYKDYRISSIRIKGVRGIPKSIDYPFGFDLINEKSRNCSAIILGANGSGKSSIFSALEYIYCNEIGEKKLRSGDRELDKTDYEDYLTYYNESFQNSFCDIITNSGEYTLTARIFNSEKVLSKVNPQTHFISDFDLYHNGQLDYLIDNDVNITFHYLIANRLGLGNLLSFNSIIQSIANYGRPIETKEINKKNKTQSLNFENIEKWKKDIVEKQILVKKLTETNSHNSTDYLRKKHQLIVSSLNRANTFEIKFSDLINSLELYKTTYLELKMLIKDDTASNETQFLILGLDLLKQKTQCPFCLDSNKTLEQITENALQRISGAKEYARKNEDVNAFFYEAINNVENYINRLNTIQELFQNDIAELSSFNEINELLANEKQLASEISSSIDTETIYELQKIDKKGGFNPKEQKRLYDLLTQEGKFLEHFFDLINRINNLLEKREQLFKEVLKGMENYLKDSEGISNQLAIIKSDINNLEKQINDSIKENEILEKEVSDLESEKKILQKVKEEARAFSSLLDFKINEIVKESFKPIETLFNDVINEFYSDEPGVHIEPYIEEVKDEETVNSYISIRIIKSDDQEISVVSPTKYFNTFRYRIFCSLVGLSIALASRILTKINLPLVFDDIFYAADYQSRTTVELFLKKLIQIYKLFTPDMPLQFVLFTNDELVFECAREAILTYPDQVENEKFTELNIPLNSEWKLPIVDRTIFARMFPPRDKDNIPSGVENKFWNLLFQLSR